MNNPTDKFQLSKGWWLNPWTEARNLLQLAQALFDQLTESNKALHACNVDNLAKISRLENELAREKTKNSVWPQEQKPKPKRKRKPSYYGDARDFYAALAKQRLAELKSAKAKKKGGSRA